MSRDTKPLFRGILSKSRSLLLIFHFRYLFFFLLTILFLLSFSRPPRRVCLFFKKFFTPFYPTPPTKPHAHPTLHLGTPQTPPNPPNPNQQNPPLPENPSTPTP